MNLAYYYFYMNFLEISKFQLRVPMERVALYEKEMYLWNGRARRGKEGLKGAHTYTAIILGCPSPRSGCVACRHPPGIATNHIRIVVNVKFIL